MGRRDVKVPATKHQPARTAPMAVSWAEVQIQPTIAVLSVVSQLLLTLRDESRRANAQVRRATDVMPVE